MIDAWTIVRWVHLIGATVWVGGQLALTFVVTPAARQRLGDAERAAVMREAGRRYALATMAGVLPLQLATGLALAYHRGVDMGTFGQSQWGQALSIKLVLVVVAVALAGVHGALAAKGRAREARVASLSGVGTSVAVLLFAAALVP